MGPPPVRAGEGALGVGAEGVAACGMTGVGTVPKFDAVRGTDDGVNSSGA